MIRADLHNHLGRDGANPGFDETINIAHSRLGNGGIIGIANSDDYRFEKFVSQRGKYSRTTIDNRAVYVHEKDMWVVKCQEMFTEKGDILAVAMPKSVNVKTKKVKDAMKAARGIGASLVAVHSFYKQGIGKFLEDNLDLLPEFASFEVYNGSAEFSLPPIFPKNANPKALDFYNFFCRTELRGMPGMSSFTDGHSAEVIGTCYTELPPVDVFSNNLISYFDSELRRVHSLDRLHMQPNKQDAARHYFNMALVKLGLI
jgi:hypothetical protein